MCKNHDRNRSGIPVLCRVTIGCRCGDGPQEKSPSDEEGGMSRYSGGNAADSLAIVREFPLKVVLANQRAG